MRIEDLKETLVDFDSEIEKQHQLISYFSNSPYSTGYSRIMDLKIQRLEKEKAYLLDIYKARLLQNN